MEEQREAEMRELMREAGDLVGQIRPLRMALLERRRVAASEPSNELAQKELQEIWGRIEENSKRLQVVLDRIQDLFAEIG